jgi:Flp pilus assembly protein TadD
MNTAIEQIRAGVGAHLNGNLKAAESAYLAALTVDAANATAHNNLGFIYGQCQRWDAVFAELLRHYPGDQETLLDLAVLQLSLDNPATALAKLEQLYIKDATNERIRFYLALALRACGEPARASDLLQEIAIAQGLYAQKARQILEIH